MASRNKKFKNRCEISVGSLHIFFVILYSFTTLEFKSNLVLDRLQYTMFVIIAFYINYIFLNTKWNWKNLQFRNNWIWVELSVGKISVFNVKACSQSESLRASRCSRQMLQSISLSQYCQCLPDRLTHL